MKRLVWVYLLCLLAAALRAEDPNAMISPDQAAAGAAAQSPANPSARSLSVLPSTDTSSLNLGTPLQYALSTLFQQTQYYNVSMGAYALTGFGEQDIGAAYRTVGTEIVTFAYLEPERVSIFLFDSMRPKEFIVSTQNLVDPMMGNQINQQVVEYKFKLAFDDLLNQYYQAQFQPLPGTQTEQVAAATTSAAVSDDPKRRAEESRKLFRELASLQDGGIYIGGAMGMTRYSGGTGSASTVDFGAFVGFRVSERVRAEVGLDLFSHALLHGDVRYRIPFAERYVTLSATCGIGMIMGVVTQPLNTNPATLNTGGFVFGPGVSVEVPLLGATVRGEVKFYFGDGSILFGTYGITYTI